MIEPILTKEQKNELINLINKSMDIIKNSIFIGKKFNRKLIYNNGAETECFIRILFCEFNVNKNKLVKYNCDLCWINWFITEYELIQSVTNENIKQQFDVLKKNEIDKRNDFKCYKLIFKCLKNKDKDIMLNIGIKMLSYLKK